MVSKYIYSTLILIILSKVNSSKAARILGIFPAPMLSHQFVFRAITQEIVKQGHEIVVITPCPAFTPGKRPPNITEIDVHKSIEGIWNKNFESVITGKKDDIKLQKEIFSSLNREILYNLFAIKEVKQLINNESNTFDIIMIEAVARMSLILSHRFKAPVIMVSSLGAQHDNLKTFGAPDHPKYYPTTYDQRLYNLTLWETIKKMYLSYWFKYIDSSHEELESRSLKNVFGGGVPSISEMKSYPDNILFLNVHRMWADNQPVPLNIVFLGGVHQRPESKLSEELTRYLDSSKNGVLYVSFGSNVQPSMVPTNIVQVLMKVLGEMPYNVLWKWDQNKCSELPDNIKISNWFPQSELLKHPNIKLFITQGGLHSTDEAIDAGVPLIAIPFLGDQWYNGEKYKYHKIGAMIYPEYLTEELLRNTVATIVNDNSYRDNIAKLRIQMTDLPIEPIDSALWWTNYVLKYGASHLRSPAAALSDTEYYEVDLLALAFASISIIVVVFVYSIGSLYTFLKCYIKNIYVEKFRK